MGGWGEGVVCVGQVTWGENPPQHLPPHSWREWEIRLRATDICVREEVSMP